MLFVCSPPTCLRTLSSVCKSSGMHRRPRKTGLRVASGCGSSLLARLPARNRYVLLRRMLEASMGGTAPQVIVRAVRMYLNSLISVHRGKQLRITNRNLGLFFSCSARARAALARPGTCARQAPHSGLLGAPGRAPEQKAWARAARSYGHEHGVCLAPLSRSLLAAEARPAPQ